MSELKRNAILVLGMYRSGGSVLAGCLNIMGARLGNNLVTAEEANDSSLEHNDIVVAHDILLRDLGCSWDMIGALPQDWIDSEAASRAKESIKSIIATDFKGARLWVVKDPRICRLFPIWRELLLELEIDPAIVVLSRHPREVSSAVRDQFQLDREKGELLWLVHYQEALAACREHRHCLITYDKLLADPIASLKVISQRLKISYPRSIRVHSRHIIEFVRSDLKHYHASDPDECSSDRENPGYAEWIYGQMRMRQLLDHPVDSRDKTDRGANVSPDGGLVDIDEGFLPILTETASHDLADSGAEAAAQVSSSLLKRIGEFERRELESRLEKERLILASKRGSPLPVCRLIPASMDEQGFAPIRDDWSKPIPIGEWYKVSFTIENAVHATITEADNTFILEPVNLPSTFAVSTINIVDRSRDNILWSANGDTRFKGCEIRQSAIELRREDTLLVMSTGPDPRLHVGPLNKELVELPLQLDIWLKIDTTFAVLHEIWKHYRAREDKHTKLEKGFQALQEQRRESDEAAKKTIAELSSRIDHTKQELEQTRTQAETEKQRSEELVDDLKQKGRALDEDIRRSKQEQQALADDIDRLKNENHSILENAGNLKQEKQALEQNVDDLKRKNRALDEDIRRFKQEQQALADDIDRLKNENHSILENAGNLKQEKQALEQNVDDLKRKNQALDEDIRELNQDKQSLQESVSRLEKELSDRSATIQLLERKLETAEEKLRLLKKELSDYLR